MKEIPLTRGKVALVDDSDFERLPAHKWYAHKAQNTQFALLTSREAISRVLRRLRLSRQGHLPYHYSTCPVSAFIRT
jgi:hypothetical protein